ncbi:MAG: hypothetical protein LBQ79_11350 [Deltaproteobacteria bacterium]|nr:hypothetical protein [Deltaproteobacteria bacterium]
MSDLPTCCMKLEAFILRNDRFSSIGALTGRRVRGERGGALRTFPSRGKLELLQSEPCRPDMPDAPGSAQLRENIGPESPWLVRGEWRTGRTALNFTLILAADRGECRPAGLLVEIFEKQRATARSGRESRAGGPPPASGIPFRARGGRRGRFRVRPCAGTGGPDGSGSGARDHWLPCPCEGPHASAA